MFKTLNYNWRQLRYIFREIPLMVKANEINARYIDIPAKKIGLTFLSIIQKRRVSTSSKMPLII